MADQLVKDTGPIETTPGNKSGSKPDSQTKKKLEGLIEDIDFSDVDEHIRNDVIAKVTEKVKHYDSGFRSKTEDLSKERKSLEIQQQELKDLIRLRDEIQNDPDLEEAVTKVINDHRAGIKSTKKEIDKNLKLLDQILESTDDSSQKEQLRQMREIIKQESGSPELLEELKKMKDELASLKTATSASISGRFETEFGKLEDKFGDLARKFKEDIRTMAYKYPEYLANGKFSRLLYHFADDSEIETALLDHAKKKEKGEIKRKEEGTYPSGEEITVSKVTVPRDRLGRVNWRGLFQEMKDKGKFKEVI